MLLQRTRESVLLSAPLLAIILLLAVMPKPILHAQESDTNALPLPKGMAVANANGTTVVPTSTAMSAAGPDSSRLVLLGDIPARLLAVDAQGAFVYASSGYDNNGYQLLVISAAVNDSFSVVGRSVLLPDKIVDVRVQGGYAYVAAGGTIYVFDVSTPSTPRLVGNLEMANTQISQLEIAGSYLYAVGPYTGLSIINIADPIHPYLSGRLGDVTYASRIVLSGNYAFVKDAYLNVIDVSTPSQPVLRWRQYQGVGSAMAIAGRYLFLSFGGDFLRVFDIANPLAPTGIADYRLPNQCPGNPCQHGVDKLAVAGKYLFYPGWNLGLRVIDISDPWHLSQIAEYGGPWMVGAVVEGEKVYVVDSGLGSQIFRFDSDVAQCIAPSGLAVCALEPGDILLERTPDYAAVFGIGGTYFTHAAVYLGRVAARGGDPADVRPRIAEAQGYAPNVYDQVWETWLSNTPWWSGDSLLDWAVVRPKTTSAAVYGAVAFARDKASQVDVVFDIGASKSDEKRYYCSKLVWKSYKDGSPNGPNLEVDVGYGNIYFGLWWVTPDDVYYGSPVVQAMPSSPEPSWKRPIFIIWSPAHLTLIDPLGRRTGFDASTGGTVHEIPGAQYYVGGTVVAETITAPSVGPGWQTVVTGYSSGAYTAESGYALQGTTRSYVRSTTYAGRIDTYPVQGPRYPTYLPLVRNR